MGKDSIFQADAMRARREAERKRKEELLEYAEKLRNQSSIKPLVTSAEIALNGEDKITLEVREGESLEDKLAVFAKNYSIAAAGVDQVRNLLQANVKPERPMIVAIPIADGLGVRRPLVVREGDNVTETVRNFCIKYNIVNYADDDLESVQFAELVMTTVQDSYNATLQRPVILEVPFVLPDGRKPVVRVREGEQHDLAAVADGFMLAYDVQPGMKDPIVNQIHARLPPVLVYQPVQVGPLLYQVRITSKDPAQIEKTVTAFLEFQQVDLSIVPAIRQQAIAKLSPGTLAAPARNLG
uniref:Uncharacterized protein n=1 Tax=Phaeomonas parva TaxID=124430 RepID=A0A7S1XRV1_9STRA|mmetsp:Transcript_33127/g.104820  ORF Transcript_33127/g.104820 Transcript_33127/m.104820 type:complete len:297 (+) Transcript_33127:520-1410(+)